MKWAMLAGVAIVLAAVGLGTGGPAQRQAVITRTLPALRNWNQTYLFEGGSSAQAIVIGDGRTFMALYVYDQYGNCVAHDDRAVSQTRDDLAAEWVPPGPAPYTVEIVNLGRVENKCQIAIR